VSGDGPLDLVFLVGGPFPIDLLSEDPGFIRVRKRLGAFSRTVWSDRRGLGASEGDPRDSLAGEIFDADLTAVLDAVGFERPAMVGTGESGAFAIRFSVTHPDRVSAVVLVNTHAHYVREAKPSSGHVMWVPLAILGVLLFLVGVGVSAWKLNSGAGGSAGSVDPRTVRTTVHSPTGMNPGPAPGALPLPPHGGAPIPYVP
jgi:pimeloyl-ACP methyl ester carboxylesterase